jgi:predicted SAM-dependent methyltransferase
LEHIEYPFDAERFIAEVFRVLRKGGVIDIGVPDTEQAIAAYAEGKSARYFQLIEQHGFHPPWCETRMEHLNCHFRHSDHLFAYDFETLAALLRRGGFVEIERRPFDTESDSHDREGLTLYVRARKPE